MASHNDKGKLGEQLAADYFSALGYMIIHRNWRYKHCEVDIIASKNAVLHFIEVKCRSSDQYGFPEENVSEKKIRHLIDASEAFLYLFPEWKRIQFDVLSVTLVGENGISFFLIEDVYIM